MNPYGRWIIKAFNCCVITPAAEHFHLVAFSGENPSDIGQKLTRGCGIRPEELIHEQNAQTIALLLEIKRGLGSPNLTAPDEFSRIARMNFKCGDGFSDNCSESNDGTLADYDSG